MKYLCIHGHFYQPPRENAWLEFVEHQDSATPFHDWNDRINFECYAPNATARILDEQGLIQKIHNNYTRMSYNFGPTLLSWLEQFDKETYQYILDADKLSQERFGGHGSAVAQAYSHLILPLANERDKKTQIIWAIKDFKHRFKREPEGLWLAETAADTASLEVLAEQGIKYTILAPRQAKAFRKIGNTTWTATTSIDTQRAYLCKLPSGRSISLFFYDGNVAQEVAFNGLLNNGKRFAHRLAAQFTENKEEPQLVHIATDGESYGHHHRFGEMALADCLNYLEENDIATLTNYGEFLEKHPPLYEAQIHENSSWSCVHGVERWRNDCGCNSGRAGWHQRWRKPLRDALDWLRDAILPMYETEMSKFVVSPWEVRNAYIDIILNRSEVNIMEFIARHATRPLKPFEQIHFLRLLEMQRNAMLMYTSCGWFFDEISGLETHQIMQYACRAIQYAKQVGNLDLNDQFIRLLTAAPSNVYENGAVGYLKYVVPAQLDLERVGMHFAVASLFDRFAKRSELFNYTATTDNFERIIAGNQRLVLGRSSVKSKITLSEKEFSFVAVYLGQHHIIGNISTEMDSNSFEFMKKQAIDAFHSTNITDVLSTLQVFFGSSKYTIWNLFHDEKKKVLQKITDQSLEGAEEAFRELYNNNYQLMKGMRDSGLAVPDAFVSAVRYIINVDMQRLFAQEKISVRELNHLSNELTVWNVTFADAKKFELIASERIFTEIKKLEYSEENVEQIELLNSILAILTQMKLPLNLWKSQNIYYSMFQQYRKNKQKFVNENWKNSFMLLGGYLKVEV
jgi:alpha-amylase/alpha-mannosidase (GH57 family)